MKKKKKKIDSFPEVFMKAGVRVFLYNTLSVWNTSEQLNATMYWSSCVYI